MEINSATLTTDPIPPLKKGFLTKQGRQFVRNWKKRFFVLHGGYLSYYVEESNQYPYGIDKKGSITLAFSYVSEDSSKTNDRQILIVSKSSENNLLVEAETAAEAKEWTEAINKHIKYYNIAYVKDSLKNTSTWKDEDDEVSDGNISSSSTSTTKIQSTKTSKQSSTSSPPIKVIPPSSTSTSSSSSSTTTTTSSTIPSSTSSSSSSTDKFELLKKEVSKLFDIILQFFSKILFDDNYRKEIVDLISLCFGDYGRAIILNYHLDIKFRKKKNKILQKKLLNSSNTNTNSNYSTLNSSFNLLIILIVLLFLLFFNILSFFEIFFTLLFPIFGVLFITLGVSLLISSILSHGNQLSLTISPPYAYSSWKNQSISEKITKKNKNDDDDESNDDEELLKGKLIESGTYLFVRHPMYSGILLICLGKCLKINKFYAFLLFLPIVWIINSLADAEEELLLEEFPEKYKEFKQSRKKFVPFIF